MSLPSRMPLVLLLAGACTTATDAPPPDARAAADADAAPPGAADGGPGPAVPTHRAASIPIGIENVNDSPLLDASYRALLRFVPDRTLTIDRMYFGYKLRGAHCWDDGQAGYGAGDGGTLDATLVDIDAATGLTIQNAAKVVVKDAQITVKKGEPFLLKNAQVEGFGGKNPGAK